MNILYKIEVYSYQYNKRYEHGEYYFLNKEEAEDYLSFMECYYKCLSKKVSMKEIKIETITEEIQKMEKCFDNQNTNFNRKYRSNSLSEMQRIINKYKYVNSKI